MAGGTWRWCARGANWWVRRNPTYLFSAAAMAVGARLYLVAPDAVAGDIGLILLTLGVLQAYEVVVVGVLLLLHRGRRSPEDQPSLLLIAGLFWTGPMAAAVEMTARHGEAGGGFAAAAGVAAIVTLRVVRREIGLHLSRWGQLAAGACVALLALAPRRLRIPHATEGTDELALYGCWWLLGGIVLLTLGALAWHGRRVASHTPGRPDWRHLHIEMAFLVMVYAATAAHLWGMNYAFFGNARLFYAAPLLGAVTIVLFEYFARVALRGAWLWWTVGALPIAGIVAATAGFHEKVPVCDMLAALRDPLPAALLLAAAAWWFGCLRGGPAMLLHVGSAALVMMAFRVVGLSSGLSTGFDSLLTIAPLSRNEAALTLYALVGYLLAIARLRRSRGEILAALGVHWLAFSLVVVGRAPSGLMSICLLGGWTWLAAVHVMINRPRWAVTAWPIAALVLITGAFGWQSELRWSAGTHAATLVVVLVLIGTLYPWTRYRRLGIGAGTLFLSAGVVPVSYTHLRAHET